MAAPYLRIDVWDVGQGDCSVITLPDGSLFVIDVGPSYSPFIPWIAARPHLRIFCLALTHNDADHCGALTPLLDATLGRLGKIRALVEPFGGIEQEWHPKRRPGRYVPYQRRIGHD